MLIDLAHQKPFASGYNRHCFRHPTDPSRCLKITRSENIEARFARLPAAKKLLGKKRLDDNLQELTAYRQRAIVQLIEQGSEALVWEHLPRFFGQADTSLGPANQSELLLNARGEPAETLEHYLQRAGFDQTARKLVEDVCAWLAQTGILTRNLLPHNPAISSQAGKKNLFLVDGLGAPSFPRMLSVNKAWRKRYINRRIRRFHKRIEWEVSGRKTSWNETQKL